MADSASSATQTVAANSPVLARRRKRPFDDPDKARAAIRKRWAQREGPTRRDLPADFLGHLPISLTRASSDLLPRILSDEVSFRSSILDRIAFMESHIVKALEESLYSVELASLPTLLREWRACLELSLRIVEKTKGLGTGDAAVDQVSGLLAKEALLRGELERLGVVDPSGRIRRPVEHQTAPEAAGGANDPPTMPGQGSAPDRVTSGPADGKRAPSDRGRGGKRAPGRRGAMTTGSLSGGRTGDRQALLSGTLSSPIPESLSSPVEGNVCSPIPQPPFPDGESDGTHSVESESRGGTKQEDQE